MTMMVDSLKVAVIGAGAAGLAAARVCRREGLRVCVLEQDEQLGGVWRHVPGSTSRPMYQNLRTNLPREIMAYREKPWNGQSGGPGGEFSYVSHRDVLAYLQDYAKQFGLEECITYGAKVTQLTVLSDSSSSEDKWPKIRLEWEKKSNHNNIKQQHSDVFDAVCICNGHYAAPSSPHIPGLELFGGRILHSIAYDDPSEFAHRTVLCVGARASGSDLAREISQHAQHVYLSDATASQVETRGNVTRTPRTVRILPDQRVEFDIQQQEDGEEPLSPRVDVIVFCSGYDYRFHFLNKHSNLDLQAAPGERRVMPLYKQLWHARHPSVTFIGLPHSVVPFPLFELQAEAVVEQLKTHGLPSLRERLEQANGDATSGGSKQSQDVKDTHHLGSQQWEYCRQMAKLAGNYNDDLENYISTNQAIYEHSSKERKALFPGGPDTYRQTRYERDDEHRTFRVVSQQKETSAALR